MVKSLIYITRKISNGVLDFLAKHCICQMWPYKDQAFPRSVILANIS